MMMSLKNPSRLVQVIFLSGVATLLAGCLTTQGPSNGTQVGQTPTRPTAVAPAQTSAPATVMPVAPAAPKLQAAAASPAPAKLVAPTATGAVANVSYQELVKLHSDDSGDPRKAYGKNVQVSVTGKGEIGYFAKKSDGITFVCDTGDKTLTANRAIKGNIRGIVFQSEPWEGATVYHLKNCQIVK